MTTQMPQQETPVPVPHNREAEEAVIGSVLINPDIMPECRVVIKSADEFYIHRHRFIWKAYEALQERGTEIDVLTVSEQLERNGMLGEIGGSAYLTTLISQVPSSLNAGAYAGIVHENFVRRALLGAANEIAALAYRDKPIEDVLGDSSAALGKAVEAGTRREHKSLNEIIKIVDTEIETRRSQGSTPGIPTGLVDLDKKLGGGAQKSDLLIVAGRPGQGKTTALLQFACHAAGIGKRVALFSLEMPANQLLKRLLTHISGIDYQTLSAGKFSGQDEAKYINALDHISQLDLEIDDTPGVTPLYIKSRLQILNAERPVDLIAIDSLNLLRSTVNYKDRTDLAMDRNATEIKDIAREMDVPIWLAHQMNRRIDGRSENAKPVLSDLREGGEQPTDIVIFLHHKYDEIKKVYESSDMVIAKHRNGPTGDVSVVFDEPRMTFHSAYRTNKNF